jgi:hypothetical protein
MGSPAIEAPNARIGESMASDMIKVRVRISTRKVGSECEDVLEFERAEWESMTDVQRENACRPAAFEMMEWNFEEV